MVYVSIANVMASLQLTSKDAERLSPEEDPQFVAEELDRLSRDVAACLEFLDTQSTEQELPTITAMVERELAFALRLQTRLAKIGAAFATIQRRLARKSL